MDKDFWNDVEDDGAGLDVLEEPVTAWRVFSVIILSLLAYAALQ